MSAVACKSFHGKRTCNAKSQLNKAFYLKFLAME